MIESVDNVGNIGARCICALSKVSEANANISTCIILLACLIASNYPPWAAIEPNRGKGKSERKKMMDDRIPCTWPSRRSMLNSSTIHPPSTDRKWDPSFDARTTLNVVLEKKGKRMPMAFPILIPYQSGCEDRFHIRSG